MGKYLLFYCFVPLLFYSCKLEDREMKGNVVEDGVLYKTLKQVEFTPVPGVETFSLTALGNNWDEAEISFRINAQSGELLYEDNFPANMLAVHEKISNTKPINQFYSEQMESFFSPGNFVDPATNINLPYSDEYVVTQNWNEIEGEENLPGFFYLIAEGDGKYIAYIPSKNRIETYYNCC